MHTKQRAAFKSRFEEGAGVVRVAGPVTLETMRALRREIFAGVMMNDVDRLLCDFSAAIVTLSKAEWAIYTRENGSEHALELPVGLLVGSEAVEAARRHCDALNARGRVSLAFVTSSSAYRWLGVPALQVPPAALLEVGRG